MVNWAFREQFLKFLRSSSKFRGNLAKTHPRINTEILDVDTRLLLYSNLNYFLTCTGSHSNLQYL